MGALSMKLMTRKTDRYTELTGTWYRLPRVTTVEDLIVRVTPGLGAVLRNEGSIIVVDMVGGEYIAGVYEINPDEVELKCFTAESEIHLVTMANQTFKDGGSAAAWALRQC